jgi:hypothetical protein
MTLPFTETVTLPVPDCPFGLYKKQSDPVVDELLNVEVVGLRLTPLKVDCIRTASPADTGPSRNQMVSVASDGEKEVDCGGVRGQA